VDRVGYRNSGRDFVLVNKLAQHVPSANSRGPEVTQPWRQVPDRRLKIEPAMEPSLVVVLDVGPKDAFQVSSAEDQGPVQALGPDGAHPSFPERVGVRGPDRGQDDPHAPRVEHLVEGPGDLGVSVVGGPHDQRQSAEETRSLAELLIDLEEDRALALDVAQALKDCRWTG
jgi:hypothetical protein